MVGVAVGLALYQLLSFPVLDQLVVYSLLSEGLIMAISLVGLVGVQNTRKLKGIYPFLMAGFSLMFLSMLTDMLDEVVVHPMWITAVFEDLFQAVGYILVVAGLVRWAWHNEETKEQLYRLATTDYLTGAYNRRHFSKTLHDEVARAKRYGTSLSLISFDLDHFKNVNDRFGHDVGDRVLKDVAGLMERMSRASDTFARMGGRVHHSRTVDEHRRSQAVRRKIASCAGEPSNRCGGARHGKLRRCATGGRRRGRGTSQACRRRLVQLEIQWA